MSSDFFLLFGYHWLEGSFMLLTYFYYVYSNPS